MVNDKYLKAIIFPVAVWIAVGLWYYNSVGSGFSIPSPPTSGNPLLLGIQLIGYAFALLLQFFAMAFSVMSFSFIPAPYNLYFAVPLLIIFAYGVIGLILDIIDSIKGIAGALAGLAAITLLVLLPAAAPVAAAEAGGGGYIVWYSYSYDNVELYADSQFHVVNGSYVAAAATVTNSSNVYLYVSLKTNYTSPAYVFIDFKGVDRLYVYSNGSASCAKLVFAGMEACASSYEYIHAIIRSASSTQLQVEAWDSHGNQLFAATIAMPPSISILVYAPSGYEAWALFDHAREFNGLTWQYPDVSKAIAYTYPLPQPQLYHVSEAIWGTNVTTYLSNFYDYNNQWTRVVLYFGNRYRILKDVDDPIFDSNQTYAVFPATTYGNISVSAAAIVYSSTGVLSVMSDRSYVFVKSPAEYSWWVNYNAIIGIIASILVVVITWFVKSLTLDVAAMFAITILYSFGYLHPIMFLVLLVLLIANLYQDIRHI